MNIYKITSDTDNYKFFVYEDNVDSTITLDFVGQSLAHVSIDLRFQIFKDPKKKNDKRSDEFDASCYYDGILLVTKRTCDILKESLNDKIELIPVKTDIGKFFFVNVMNVTESIKGINSMNYDQIMEMTRKNDYPFDEKKITDQLIFRDSKLLTEYFVTPSFIDFIDSNNIKGLRFDFVGISI